MKALVNHQIGSSGRKDLEGFQKFDQGVLIICFQGFKLLAGLKCFPGVGQNRLAKSYEEAMMKMGAR